MISLFGIGRQTTDDTEEQLIRAWGAAEMQNHQDLQVRMRQSHTMILEEQVHDQHRRLRKAHQEVRTLKARVADLERANGELAEHYRFLEERYFALRASTLNIAVDRRALAETFLGYLEQINGTAGVNSVSGSSGGGGRVVLPDEHEQRRNSRGAQIKADPAAVERMGATLDRVVEERVCRGDLTM